MATGVRPSPGRKRRQTDLAKLQNSPILGRFAIVNHFNRTVAALAPTSNFPGLKAFLPQNLWAWISNYLKNAFTPRYPFPDYTKSGKTGVYSLSPAAGADTITIAIAGDWGTGTQEAETIADLMIATKPDLTIHLGDVYYVGDAPEIQENCFGMPTNGFQGVKWPHGSQGSFSLNGNHEMYANGKPYFKILLPTLGMRGNADGQVASFFCLDSAQWRIVAIDTAYNSVGIPILSQIPVINSIPFIGGDCHLEEALLTWLRTVVKPKANPKATLLLSHHQYFTAFKDHAYTKPAKQLMEFFQGQEVVWIWGHEHRLGIYNKFSKDGGITVYGRCLGHGGMPVDVGTPDSTKAPLKFYDPRTHALDDKTEVGQNGFVSATIKGGVLTLDYRDVENKQLLVEQFTAGPGGSLTCTFRNPDGVLQPPPKEPS